MPFIGIGEFRPDLPDYNNPGSALIQNVLPRTEQSYAPFPSLSVASAAIGNRCQGAYAMQDNSGNVRLFLGDSSKLYRMTPASSTPADVSKTGGYATGSTSRWEMLAFGLRLVAANGTDPIQGYLEGTDSAFSNLITSGMTTLTAYHLGIVRDFLFLGNTTDGTNGAQPKRVWWSAINDPTNFPTPGTTGAAAVQSDYQDLVGTSGTVDAGIVQGIVGNLGSADGAIFQERAVTRIIYAGAPSIFVFTPAENVRGTAAPGSICQLGSTVYYLGEDGFYAFDGSSSRPIGFQKIDKYFFSDLDQSHFDRITSTVDAINKIVYWAYPGAGNTNGNPNRILAYHTLLDRFTITAANDIQLEILLRSLSFGYTLEQLDAVYPNLDMMPVSLDSRTLTGGKVILSCIDTSHQLNTFTGSNLAVTVQTTETQIYPGKRALITGARPIVDGGTPSVSIGYRDLITNSVNYTSASQMDSRGFCAVRAEGRYHRAQITIPAGSSFTHLQGIEVPDENITNTGSR